MKLSDKYTVEKGRVYLTGIQALVRLPIDQMRRDRRAGLNTGTFISGYEGSPLGGYDMTLVRAGKMLAEHNIHFSPGVNFDLMLRDGRIRARAEKVSIDENSSTAEAS